MLEIGTKAPAFTLPDQNGEMRSLTDYQGQKVILYFYPKDMTSGCTAEACSLRDGYSDLTDMGYEVIGISPDTAQSHLKFAQKHNLNFHLLPDPEHKIIEAYGAWGEKRMAGRTYMGVVRTTFIINIDGKVLKIINKVDTKNHAEQIKQEVAGL